MLPSFLESSYKRYKNDTSKFIKWLCENRKKCRYKTSVGGSSEKKLEDIVAVKAPRLKGKARKEAKQASKAPKIAQLPERKYIIPTREFLPLAKAIVKSKDITIPYEIIQTGLRTVSARKKQAALFEDMTGSKDEEMAQSNEGHVYLISALEEVIMTLQPCFASTAGASKDRPNPEPPCEYYRGSAESICSARSRRTCRGQRRSNTITSSKDTWYEFALGKLDLITASVTTNAAFQVAIQMQNELTAVYPDCRYYDCVVEALMTKYEATQGTNSRNENTSRRLTISLPLYTRGGYGVYNPKADRDKMDVGERDHEDMMVLRELLHDYQLVQRFQLKYTLRMNSVEDYWTSSETRNSMIGKSPSGFLLQRHTCSTSIT
ncbi:hypothetical protein BDZ45DRAFT_735653 [Acephala macrosclerotiorum]|nr:hypothetical protein BDZ45DRAFT_735653 [Acephala macrosclerotiorum]